MSFINGTETDQNILEQTNPVFNTAKMTLFQLADAGNKDAAAICEKLGLTREETQNSRTTTASLEQMEAAALLIEHGIGRWARLLRKAAVSIMSIFPADILRGLLNLLERISRLSAWIFPRR